ncbi:MAG: DNA polymerase III subunit chi [Zoogloeaceae bacterium]|jgi:DNA polymerase-3 subunit chi|nr:DNA polymerase III subunit chi [Zoogloeaceae bacterium]
MTQVFVYHHVADRLQAACGIVAAAVRQGKDFTLYTPDVEHARLVDRLLWTLAPLSFIPHCQADAPLAAETPVLLAASAEHLAAIPASHSRQRLLNLGEEVPPGFERYASLIEIISGNPDERQYARARIRHYQSAGCALQYIDKSASVAGF